MTKVKQKYPKPHERYYLELTRWGKVFHWVKVVLGLLAIVAIFLAFAYVVLVIFGVYGYLLKFRDIVLLDFAHWLFD